MEIDNQTVIEQLLKFNQRPQGPQVGNRAAALEKSARRCATFASERLIWDRTYGTIINITYFFAGILCLRYMPGI
jgi:hypothetical protein